MLPECGRARPDDSPRNSHRRGRHASRRSYRDRHYRHSVGGTTTDANGKFAIAAAPGQRLSVSYIGYKETSVEVTTKTDYDIRLESDNAQIDEVIVVGYGTQKKVNVTGSVATIDSKAFDKRPIVSTSAALQGMAPGVTVTTQSGAPGDDGGAIRIRGINSFGGSSTSPLVLIDGIEGSLDSVDPNLIESISILKDAASSSIYGSRAANGVILVTTKRGSKERFSITYKGYVGWQSPTDLPDMVNALEFRELTRAMYLNDGVDLNGEKPGSTPFPITTTRIWRYTAKTGARTRIFIPIRTGRTPC